MISKGKNHYPPTIRLSVPHPTTYTATIPPDIVSLDCLLTMPVLLLINLTEHINAELAVVAVVK